MQIKPEQLERQLERGLAPLWLVSGDEPLLLDECGEAIRAHARKAGYTERTVYTVEPGFEWELLRNAAQSMSLFAEKQLIELRLPTGKPGEAGAQLLSDVAQNPPPDTIFLVIAGKLDKPQRESAWVGAFEAAGTHVMAWPLDAARFPDWLSQRFSARGLKPEPGVVELLAWHLEGNLLAASQEIEKLAMLCGSGPVRRADVEESLADSARFSVYQLVDAALAGEAAVARRILGSLRAEGTEPILIHWALVRELRAIAQVSQELQRGKPEGAALARVWQSRRSLVGKAIRRIPMRGWLAFLRRAAVLDRVIKGQAPGDRWLELERLLLAVAGLKPFFARRDYSEMNA